MASHFCISKLVVGDIEKCAAFYEAVCGLTRRARVDGEVDGRKITEFGYALTGVGAATFVLFSYHDAPEPKLGETIMGFSTPDIEAFLSRVRAHGGEVFRPARELPDYGVKVAFARDIEGHVIEIVQPLAADSPFSPRSA